MPLTQPTSITLSLLLLALSGCSSIQEIYDQTVPELFTSSDKKENAGKMELFLQSVDKAQDSVATRNKLIYQLITDSDLICDNHLKSLPSTIERWKIENKKTDKLNEKLDAGISRRQFDRAKSTSSLIMKHEVSNPAKALTKGIYDSIKRSRNIMRIKLDSLLETDINLYSVKQALMDVQSYHDTCSTAFGAVEFAHSNKTHLSPEEKSAAIDGLMQLRKKLMHEGLNTRSVQQKIDAIILAK